MRSRAAGKRAGRTWQVRVWCVVATLGVGASAGADDSPYCRKVRARARSDAALLMWPRLTVQGIHIPEGGDLDTGAAASSRYQLRAGVSFSPLDLYRGTRVLRVGEAECLRHSAAHELAALVAHGGARARLSALRQQEGYLAVHREEWRAVSAKAERRLEAGVITVADFETVRRQLQALERKLVEVRGGISQLEASGAQAPRRPLRRSAREWLSADAMVEREASHVRALDAWRVQIAGGVSPGSPVDWYGLVEVSFNLGAFTRDRQERLFLEARAKEARSADYELRTQAGVLIRQLRAARAQAEQEREELVKGLAFLGRTRAALERSESQNAPHARDALALEEISLEADRIFLEGLASSLTSLLEDRHGR